MYTSWLYIEILMLNCTEIEWGLNDKNRGHISVLGPRWTA